jgi:hypothetical protein
MESDPDTKPRDLLPGEQSAFVSVLDFCSCVSTTVEVAEYLRI